MMSCLNTGRFSRHCRIVRCSGGSALSAETTLRTCWWTLRSLGSRGQAGDERGRGAGGLGAPPAAPKSRSERTAALAGACGTGWASAWRPCSASGCSWRSSVRWPAPGRSELLGDTLAPVHLPATVLPVAAVLLRPSRRPVRRGGRIVALRPVLHRAVTACCRSSGPRPGARAGGHRLHSRGKRL
jgi:hypothetical protein